MSQTWFGCLWLHCLPQQVGWATCHPRVNQPANAAQPAFMRLSSPKCPATSINTGCKVSWCFAYLGIQQTPCITPFICYSRAVGNPRSRVGGHCLPQILAVCDLFRLRQSCLRCVQCCLVWLPVLLLWLARRLALAQGLVAELVFSRAANHSGWFLSAFGHLPV